MSSPPPSTVPVEDDNSAVTATNITICSHRASSKVSGRCGAGYGQSVISLCSMDNNNSSTRHRCCQVCAQTFAQVDDAREVTTHVSVKRSLSAHGDSRSLIDPHNIMILFSSDT